MYLVLIILATQLFSSNLFKGQIVDTFDSPIKNVNITLFNNENNVSHGTSSDVEGYLEAKSHNVQRSKYFKNERVKPKKSD